MTTFTSAVLETLSLKQMAQQTGIASLVKMSKQAAIARVLKSQDAPAKPPVVSLGDSTAAFAKKFAADKAAKKAEIKTEQRSSNRRSDRRHVVAPALVVVTPSPDVVVPAPVATPADAPEIVQKQLTPAELLDGFKNDASCPLCGADCTSQEQNGKDGTVAGDQQMLCLACKEAYWKDSGEAVKQQVVRNLKAPMASAVRNKKDCLIAARAKIAEMKAAGNTNRQECIAAAIACGCTHNGGDYIHYQLCVKGKVTS